MPISDAEILALKPRAKPYKVHMGKGVYLLVRPNGWKYWRLKYRLKGRESLYSLGVFPQVSIKGAKAARDSARSLIRQGINPSVARREAKAKAVATQAVFRLGLSKGGELTIETGTNALILTFAQTQALATFLTAGKQEKELQ
jgi:Arm DNA-binding domain